MKSLLSNYSVGLPEFMSALLSNTGSCTTTNAREWFANTTPIPRLGWRLVFADSIPQGKGSRGIRLTQIRLPLLNGFCVNAPKPRWLFREIGALRVELFLGGYALETQEKEQENGCRLGRLHHCRLHGLCRLCFVVGSSRKQCAKGSVRK